MKNIIINFLIDECVYAASETVRKIVKDPVGLFTPYYEKVTVFALLGERGQWRVSKGSVSKRVAQGVEEICRHFEVTDGWIAYKADAGSNWVDCSESFTEQAKQRIRNCIYVR